MMKKLLGIVVLGLLLSGNAYALTYSEAEEKWRNDGGSAGDPNQTIILDSGKHYIVIRNKTAKTKVYHELFKENQPAEIFDITAKNYCKKNKIYNVYSAMDEIIFDDHTIYYFCTGAFETQEEFKNLNLSKDEFENLSILWALLVYDIDLEMGKKTNKKTLKKFPFAKKAAERIKAHNAKFKDSSFVFEVKKRAFAKQDTTPESEYDNKKLIIIGSGSGFFISEQGHIVSNEHVVGVCKKVKAYEEGKEIFLEIIITDTANDIGLVKGKFKNRKYLNIKSDGAELGEDIVAFGYPLTQELSDSVKLTKGIVSALSGPGNNYSQIQIDAAIQPGNSGGPVLNMNGQVVGIASAGLSKLYMAQKAEYIPENVNFAVAAQTLTTFLKANKINVTAGPSRIYSTKELAKIGEPATIQLFCMNTRAAYEKLKKAEQHSDVLLDLK